MRALVAIFLSLTLGWVSGVPADQPLGVHLLARDEDFAEETLGRFQETTGIQPVLDPYETDEGLERRLLTGHAGHDLIIASTRILSGRSIKAGLLAKLDRSKLPNWGNLDPQILKALADLDPGNQHLVPYLWGTSGLGLNEDKVKAALGKAPPESWGLIFDPENAKKLAACGILLPDDPSELLATVLVYLGRDPNSLASADLEVAQGVLDRVQSYVRYGNAAQSEGGLANGEVCVTLGASRVVIHAQTRAEDTGNGVRLEYLVPREGAPLWIDVLAIPKDAPSPEQAHRLIDFLLDPKVMAEISSFVYCANANRAATPHLDGGLRSDPSLYPPQGVRQRLFLPASRSAADLHTLGRFWARIKAIR